MGFGEVMQNFEKKGKIPLTPVANRCCILMGILFNNCRFANQRRPVQKHDTSIRNKPAYQVPVEAEQILVC